MKIRAPFGRRAFAVLAFIFVLTSRNTLLSQQPDVPSDDTGDAASSSTEQGRTPLPDAFQTPRELRLEKRRAALEGTEFRFDLRTFYFDRRQFDGSQSQAWAIGGWAGLKTGYFSDHLAIGVTGYTSQKLFGDKEKDGTLLLKTEQRGYTVLGEAYADIRIIEDLNVYVGRKEYDTPFINRNDTRMTPNTFEAVVLQGKVKLGENAGDIRYGAGYFDRIKERNSDKFVSMSADAGAAVNRGVYTAGAIYEKRSFSIGAIDYYSPDIINIAYAETKLELPIGKDWRPKLAAQFIDQRSVGDDLLKGNYFAGRQFGIKADLPIRKALFTVGYTYATDGTDMQSPWSGYPGYTSVQIQDFNRAGEGAILVRGSYEFTKVNGLSVYALAVFGTSPFETGEYRRNEYDANLQWAPSEGALKGFSIRLRYALAQQEGGGVRDAKDFRVICNYTHKF